ncbi:MAG: pyruvate formate lyase-activating protein [Oscillospiraceae bacterium]|nr:pyruvate formate lyase-activating protein [Oscillospiraceae bacterium]
MDGYIHSIESFGTVDGPGVRMVIFLQGCPMRCLYCHNPDTWEPAQGAKMSAEDILRQYDRNRAFYAHGGLTVTGGEPLLQTDFLLELFALAKERGIHTCIDTSGITFAASDPACREKLDRLLQMTDLVLLDIKHADSACHKKLTGHDNAPVLAFARHLAERQLPVWIRHVLVPGYTDGEEHLRTLGRLIASLSNVKAIDVLPYHTMGVAKYETLGLPYPLSGLDAATAADAARAKQIILAAFRESR